MRTVPCSRYGFTVQIEVLGVTLFQSLAGATGTHSMTVSGATYITCSRHCSHSNAPRSLAGQMRTVPCSTYGLTVQTAPRMDSNCSLYGFTVQTEPGCEFASEQKVLKELSSLLCRLAIGNSKTTFCQEILCITILYVMIQQFRLS